MWEKSVKFVDTLAGECGDEWMRYDAMVRRLSDNGVTDNSINVRAFMKQSMSDRRAKAKRRGDPVNEVNVADLSAVVGERFMEFASLGLRIRVKRALAGLVKYGRCRTRVRGGVKEWYVSKDGRKLTKNPR